MAHSVLNNCKKFTVQRIINPSVYWMTEYERENFKSKMKLLGSLLAKNVEIIKGNENIPIGSMVAVNNKTDFYRGVVTDVFNRENQTAYCVLLIDYGTTVETFKKNVYFIKNVELREKQFVAFEVTIHGIQPFVMDVDYEKNFQNIGIFKKRPSNTWPKAAFRFVKDVIRSCPHVFVKVVQKSKWRICGEIYIEDFQKKPVPLAQILCEKGFSIYSTIKSNERNDCDENIGIEKKIPKNALLDRKNSAKGCREVEKDKTEVISICEPIQRSCKVPNGAPSISSTVNSDNSSPKTEPMETVICYSPSWMLKKCALLSNLSSSVGNASKERHL